MSGAQTTVAHSSAFTESFAPLRERVFAVLWTATLLGNTGTFMRDVASSWLVTDISGSPTAVAMVQAAATFPVFLLAIPAGAMADILDRRKFLIATQVLICLVSVALLALAHFNAMTVSALVALTFLGGVGSALMGPTWQAIVPELVPAAHLKNAVALNSLSINIARSVGPAVGGLLLAVFGAVAAYGTDVASYAFVIAALLWWPRPQRPRDDLSERFMGAFRAGLRYTKASSELHAVLIRAALFFTCSSAVWAYLPLVARVILGGDAAFYGVLLGSIGAGAIGGAFLLPMLRQRFDADAFLLGCALVTAAAMTGLAFAPPQWLALALVFVFGAAWIFALTSLNGAAQAILPNWVRGRGLAVYLMVQSGAMTAGSIAWGLLAEKFGLVPGLFGAAACLVGVAVLAGAVKLPAGDSDLVPSNHWPEPLTNEPIENDRGPVLVLIEYRVATADRINFVHVIERLSQERRRDGAYGWGLTEDTADPERLVEWFMVESWAEHLRQHKRVSKADADVQREALQWQVGPGAPVVRHLLAIDPVPQDDTK